MNEEMKVVDGVEAVEAEVVTKAQAFTDRFETCNAFLNANIQIINMQASKAGAGLALVKDLGDDISDALNEVAEDEIKKLEIIVEAIKGVFEAPEVE